MTSLTTPTTKEINDNIIAQLEAAINQTIPLLPKAFNRVLARTMSGVFILLFKYGGWIFLQQFVQTASDRPTTIFGVTVVPLIFWGRLIGIGDPKAGTNAQLSTTITVTNQVGVLNSGTQLGSSLNGFTYLTLTTIALDLPTVTVTVRAVNDQTNGNGIGVLGNLDDGDTSLSFVNTQPSVAQGVVVDSSVVTAADAETTEEYRQRVVSRFQKQPQGGAYADYELWGLEAAGVINIYPYTGDPGQVNIYSEVNNQVDGIPDAAQLLAVFDIIEQDENGLASRRNANTVVNSLAITRTNFFVTVKGITGVGDLGEVQDEITAGVTTFFFSFEPFIPGISLQARTDTITQSKLSGLVEDIVTANGGIFDSAEFSATLGGGSINKFILGEGEKTGLVSPISFAA